MEFHKLSSPSLKDLFVRELENMILSGQISIGDKLPAERILSEKMGVSRAVVTSGLSVLEGKGFIEIKPRIGVYVADYKRKGTVETLFSILRYNGGFLKRSEIKSLLELRLVFETLAIELAVPLTDFKSLNTLKSLLADFKSSNNAKDMAESIFLIHHEICIMSGNTLLPVVFYSFKELSTQLWRKYFELHGKRALVENTESLIGAFERGDVKGAVNTFQNSLKKTINGVVSIYDE